MAAPKKLSTSARTPGTTGSAAEKIVAAKAGDLAKLTLDDDFVSVGRPHARWMCLFYGPNRIGKTRLLATVPGIILLPVQKGANQNLVPQWTKTDLSTLAEFHDALDTLRHAQHNFKAVGIEMVGDVEQLIRVAVEDKLAEASAAYKDEAKKATTIQELNEREYGAGSKLVTEAWRVILDKCDALRDERNMDVLWTAYDKVNTIKPLDGEDYPRVEPMIEGQASAKQFKGRCDYIVKLELPIRVREDEKTHKKIASLGQRVFRCVQSATLDVGCRGDALWPDTLPLDFHGGWETFRRTAQLILDHGANVEGWLATEAARAIATIDVKPGVDATREKRREVAETYFLEARNRRDYGSMWAIVEKADAEAADRAKLAKANGNNIVGATGVAASSEGVS